MKPLPIKRHSHNLQLEKVKKDQYAVYALSLGFFLAFSLLFTSTHYLVTKNALEELNTQQNALTHNATKKGISFYLKELHKRLKLFVDTHQNLIENLAENPDDDVAYDNLLDEVIRYFPNMGSFIIMDNKGNPLFEDLEGIVQTVCIQDTKKYLAQHQTQIRLHPNPIFPHIDIVSTYTSNPGKQFIFLVNFPANVVTQILHQFTSPNSRQILVSTHQPTRIEFKETGFRHQIADQWDLSQEMLAALPSAFKSIIPDTQWQLITYTSPQKRLSDQQKIQQIIIKDTLVQLVFGLLLFLILRKILNRTAENVHLIHYTASHDPLTGLYNRLHFISLLQQTLRLAQRENIHVALLFIDLDGFKPINDQYGHEAGDYVLKKVAQRLKAQRRNSDIIARLGGDEFVIALPDMKDDRTVERLIQQIRHAIERPITLPNGQTIKLGASIGLACYKGDAQVTEEIVDQLLNEADHKMYQEKQKHHHTNNA